MEEPDRHSREPAMLGQRVEETPHQLGTPLADNDFDLRLGVGRMIYEGCPNAQPIASVGKTTTRENGSRLSVARDGPEPDRP